MSEDDMLAYVRATAMLLQLPLDVERAQAVALQLSRTAALARLLDAVPLPPHEEIAAL